MEPAARDARRRSRALLGWQGDFQRIGRIGRLRMCDGKHAHDRMRAFAQQREDDRAGPIPCALFATLPRFALPQVRISDDEARPRDRPVHGFLMNSAVEIFIASFALYE
jgi:hypothetical protein